MFLWFKKEEKIVNVKLNQTFMENLSINRKPYKSSTFLDFLHCYFKLTTPSHHEEDHSHQQCLYDPFFVIFRQKVVLLDHQTVI